MKTVEVFIGTDLRGPARGRGKTVYIMRTEIGGGIPHESRPAVRADDQATESRLVLLALRDALMRMVYACEVVVYTECTYVVAALNNMWPEGWQENGWKTARGQQVKDTDIWHGILQELDDTGHIIRAVPGKHEFSVWMRCNLPCLTAGRESFTAVEPKELNLVSDRMGS